MATHDVLNQSPPRVGLDEFTSNVALAKAVRADAPWAKSELEEVGALVGGARYQRDAELANTHEPRLANYDRWGNRIDEVEYHPAYHRLMELSVAHGAHTQGWSDSRPGASVARAAAFMLFGQVEPGHGCPLSMTHAAVPVLAAHGFDDWVQRTFAHTYDPRLVADKPSAIIGMAMTEKQGGSDVRANTTRAEPADDGTHLLTGHKWFCSAPMSDAFLVLAQAPGGLTCFLLPRVLPDASRNTFLIRRLKDKLGNKSNASSEVEFDRTVAWRVGEEGRGVATIMPMVAETRLDCVLGTTSGMRQCVAEALWHARHRVAFGRLLIDQPAMTSVLIDLALEYEGALAVALDLAAAHAPEASEQQLAWRRLADPIIKYWVCKRGPEHAYEAMECLGGNGYTEAFPLARRYREQPVNAIWEGSGNVIALDLLRALGRDDASAAAVRADLEQAAGQDSDLDVHLTDTMALLGRIQSHPDDAPLLARQLAERLAIALQCASLLRRDPGPVAEAFVAARLRPGRGRLYGAVDLPTSARAVLERH